MTLCYSFSLSAEVPSGEARGAFHLGPPKLSNAGLGWGTHPCRSSCRQTPRAMAALCAPPRVTAPCKGTCCTAAALTQGAFGAARVPGLHLQTALICQAWGAQWQRTPHLGTPHLVYQCTQLVSRFDSPVEEKTHYYCPKSYYFS